jgi:tetratricopeptide (TPR) repeat protein
MTAGEVDRLLALSREARWAFPSSMGRPIRGDEPWLERVAAEREAFADAVRSLVEQRRYDDAAEIAANVWRLWMLDYDLAGGRASLAPLLEQDQPVSRARALALYADGLFAIRLGARAESRECNEAALEVAQAAGDREALALAHLGLSRVLLDEGDHERAAVLAVSARELAEGFEPALGQGPLHLHAQAIRAAGDYERAAALFEESLALNRRIGDPGMIGVELHNLGHVEIHRGNADAAARYFDECAQDGGSDPYGAALTQANKAAVAFLRGEREQAATLLSRAKSGLDEAGIEPAVDDRFEIEWLQRQLDSHFA